MGGKALIYVWAMEQELNQVKSKYLKKIKHSEDVKITSDCSSNTVQHTDSNNPERVTCESDNATKGDLMEENSKHKSFGRNSSCSGSDDQDYGAKGSDGVSNLGNACDEVCDTNINNIKDGDTCVNNSPDKSQKLHFHVNRTQFQQQDLLVPWQLKKSKKSPQNGNTFHRFYHVFTEGELETLCSDVGNCRILNSYYDQGNWAVVLEKI